MPINYLSIQNHNFYYIIYYPFTHMKVYIAVFTLSFQYILASYMTYDEFSMSERDIRLQIIRNYTILEGYLSDHSVDDINVFNLETVREAVVQYYSYAFLIVNIIKTIIDAILCQNIDSQDKDVFKKQFVSCLNYWSDRHGYYILHIRHILHPNAFLNYPGAMLEEYMSNLFSSIAAYYGIIIRIPIP